MPRPLKFRPRRIEEADLLEYKELEKKFLSPNFLTRARVVREYQQFQEMNDLSPTIAVKAWIGAQLRAGRKIGTVHTYLVYALTAVRSSLSSLEKLEWSRVMRVVSAAHADADTASAPYCDPDTFCSVITHMQGPTRLAASLIAFSGLRVADMARLRRKQIRFGKNELQIQVRLSKNRRSPAKRKILRLTNVSDMLGYTLDDQLRQLAGGDPNERPLQGITADEVNRALRTATQTAGVGHLTTYSLRKLFIQQISAFYQYDWQRVIEVTLHTKIDVVAAHYDRIIGPLEKEIETLHNAL